jgi:dTDP-4-dehydrorhamnose reductase
MRAIREVNPEAWLVQTEDLGKTYSTPTLQYQAEFENERRWLTFDALCGRVDRAHPMWGFLRHAGIAEAELERLREDACPPDVLGINHYLASERFVDERLERYPAHTHGGNGRHSYADVEAVRVLGDGTAGAATMLAETWERYGLPVAITEVHLGCTREQQLRWLHEVWTGARAVHAAGADVRAVTVWSLLGAFDWHNLLTRQEGYYEPGAFDVRAPRPRPTAVAAMVRDLAMREEHDHPLLRTPGWWRRDERLLYPPVNGGRARGRSADGSEDDRAGPPARPVLIVGATGTLGRAFARLCAERGIAYRLCSRREMEISDPARVEACLDQVAPWAVVNAAGYVRVDDAERQQAACYRANREGPGVLAAACARRGLGLLTFSSDLVFDGRRTRPYVEGDRARPLGVYGRSKIEAERRVLELLPSALVVRTSAFFGPWDEYNFIACALRALGSAVPFPAASDQTVSPTYVPDLVHASLDLLIDGERGVWHLANRGAVSWAQLACRAAELAGLDAGLVAPRPGAALGLTAARPRYSVLGSERGTLLPPLEDALARYFAARAACQRAA